MATNNVKTLNTTNTNNKTGNNVKEPDNIFSHVYIILGLFIIAISFIGYAIYSYINANSNSLIKSNSSYYGSDIFTYEPLFKENVNTIDDCVTICKNDINCDGITYNSDSNLCTGTKDNENNKAILRTENQNLSAWVKPPSLKIRQSEMSKDFTKSILVGYTTKNIVIDGIKLIVPFQIGYFSYSFNLTIYDFNKNYGSWRHIFHKGTDIPSGTSLTYQSWENLIIDYPNQIIGVWVAPFTNNLRIAVTTNTMENTRYGQYDNAFTQICDNSTNTCFITDMPNSKWKDKSMKTDDTTPKFKLGIYVEYFDLDLQNIPLNTEINITVNFRGKNVDTLFNGKIRKTFNLNGIPIFDRKNLYVFNDKTINGEINNLLYYPNTLTKPEINQIISLKKTES